MRSKTVLCALALLCAGCASRPTGSRPVAYRPRGDGAAQTVPVPAAPADSVVYGRRRAPNAPAGASARPVAAPAPSGTAPVQPTVPTATSTVPTVSTKTSAVAPAESTPTPPPASATAPASTAPSVPPAHDRYKGLLDGGFISPADYKRLSTR